MKAFFEKYRVYIGLLLLLILPAVFAIFFIKEKEITVPVSAEIQPPNVNKFFVDISGQIVKPGVYEVEEGMIILDLVDKAGGFGPDADPVYLAKELNLSSKLLSEDKIYIPQIGENSSSGSGEQSGKINLNNASLEELGTLPGIGESTAQKIIDARPFKSVEDLKNVGGIGDSKFEEIKDKVTI